MFVRKADKLLQKVFKKVSEIIFHYFGINNFQISIFFLGLGMLFEMLAIVEKYFKDGDMKFSLTVAAVNIFYFLVGYHLTKESEEDVKAGGEALMGFELVYFRILFLIILFVAIFKYEIKNEIDLFLIGLAMNFFYLYFISCDEVKN